MPAQDRRVACVNTQAVAEPNCFEKSITGLSTSGECERVCNEWNDPPGALSCIFYTYRQLPLRNECTILYGISRENEAYFCKRKEEGYVYAKCTEGKFESNPKY